MVKRIRTNWVVIGLGLVIGVALLTSVKSVRADGGDDEAESGDAPVHQHHPTFARERVNKGENKETDGTTAPNRFQAETVIKSQYKLDGEQLEVDPD